MDELERAWVRNRAMAHYRRTRGTPSRCRWIAAGLLITALVTVVEACAKLMS